MRTLSLLSLALVVGCGDDDPAEGTATDGLGPDDLCAEEAPCTGDDVADCQAERAAEQSAAASAGCDAELTLWWNCQLQSATCTDGEWVSASCTTEEAAADACIYGAPIDTGTPPVLFPPVIQSLEVSCPTSNTARLRVVAPGADGESVVIDVVSTGDPSHRYEAHRTVKVDDTTYEVVLDTESSYTEGVSTSLTCVPGIHFLTDYGDTMTYAVRAYDRLGVAHCVADGHDPVGVIAGDYADLGNGLNTGEINDLRCTTAKLGQ